MSQRSKLIDLESEEIDLSRVPGVLDDVLFSQLMNALATNETVTSLNFSNNVITADMADQLGALLNNLSSIKILTLARCELTDPSAMTIIRCARKFRSLVSLNLAKNPLTNFFVAELEKLVQSSACLEELVLIDTNITFEGVVPLVQGMLSNTSLLYCSLPFALGHVLLAEVKKILARNWRLNKRMDEAVKAYETMQTIMGKERELVKKKWTLETNQVGHSSSSRLGTVEGGRTDWSDPTTKTHMLYLSLLDKKATFEENERRGQQDAKLLIHSRTAANSSERHGSARRGGNGSSNHTAVSSPRGILKGGGSSNVRLPALTPR